MGNSDSKSGHVSGSQSTRPQLGTRSPSATFRTIVDKYKTLEEVTTALRQAGLESSNLIIGVDFTKSNEWTGKHSFGNQCLHKLQAHVLNPYESAISVIGRTLESFDDDKLIPAYGFGDASTNDRQVFSFLPQERPCYGVHGVLESYRTVLPNTNLSGPTSFAPIILKATDIVARSGQFHVLLIIADGQVTRSVDTPPGTFSPHEQATVEAIVRASHYALSIVLVGVGDGPWDTMKHFDDHLPHRQFDNFQFVDFTSVTRTYPHNPEPAFALSALMEIPDQYKTIVRLRYLNRGPTHNVLAPPALDPPPPRPQMRSAGVSPAPYITASPGPATGSPYITPAAVSMQSSQAQGTWACPRCTLLNAVSAASCGACEAPKPSISPSFLPSGHSQTSYTQAPSNSFRGSQSNLFASPQQDSASFASPPVGYANYPPQHAVYASKGGAQPAPRPSLPPSSSSFSASAHSVIHPATRSGPPPSSPPLTSSGSFRNSFSAAQQASSGSFRGSGSGEELGRSSQHEHPAYSSTHMSTFQTDSSKLGSGGGGEASESASYHPSAPPPFVPGSESASMPSAMPPAPPSGLPPAAGASASRSDRNSAREELERLQEQQCCPVCLDEPKNMAFGCGHQSCSTCGPTLQNCPICREPIRTRIKLYH